MSPPVEDLDEVLATLTLSRRPGTWVYCAVDEVPAGPLGAVVVEDEGTTLVVDVDRARELGLTWAFEAAWLTVDVRTALVGVGVTATLSRALAAADLPCNVLAGLHHDHLLVPVERADEALAVLRALRTPDAPRG